MFVGSHTINPERTKGWDDGSSRAPITKNDEYMLLFQRGMFFNDSRVFEGDV